MDKIINLIKNYPVRIMAVISAIVTVLAFYFTDVPWPLILAVFAAIIGGGETAAHFVTPMNKLHEVQTFDNGQDFAMDVLTYDKKYVWKR